MKIVLSSFSVMIAPPEVYEISGAGCNIQYKNVLVLRRAMNVMAGNAGKLIKFPGNVLSAHNLRIRMPKKIAAGANLKKKRSVPCSGEVREITRKRLTSSAE